MRHLILVSCVVVAALTATATASARTDGSTRAPSSIQHLVVSVPPATLDKVGAGQLPGKPEFSISKLHNGPYTVGGKPGLLTGALAWCPHCASDSWGLAIALSRFGSLTGLRLIDTGTYFATKYHAKPAYSHTHGLSFLDAHYSSPYLGFSSFILQDVKGRQLQLPSAAQQNALASFDPPRTGLFPAVNVGGLYGFLNSGVSPAVLVHRSAQQIATSLAKPNTAIARHIDGFANLISAAICQATGQRPAAVCGSAAVTKATGRL